MKIRPLPEIDLARIAPLSSDEKRRALEAFHLGIPPHSYQPVRSSLSDILNLEAGFLEYPRVPFERIAEVIRKKAKHLKEEEANLRVAAGLYTFVSEANVRGRREEFYPIATRIGEKLKYWHNALLILDGKPLVPFFDPRRSSALTPIARRFVLSLMHERIRIDNPDFHTVRLGIFQFARSKTGPRAPALYTDEGVELFSFDELDRMIEETYVIWREICTGREEEVRRRAGGERGSLI